MDESNKKVVDIHIEDIIPNPFQPRLSFNEDSINDLAESIKLHGIIQPLILRKNGEKYEIIAGERRYKAANLAGLQTVPAIVTELNNDQSAEVALVENLQRKNLTAIEEAKSFEKLQNKGYSQEKIAKQMGVSQSSIANKIRLLNLADGVQQALQEEKISERHARSLLNVAKDKQVELLNRIINERLTVRLLDAEIAKINGSMGTPTPPVEEVNSLNNVTEQSNQTGIFADINSLMSQKESMVDNVNNEPTNEFESLEVFELPSQPLESAETISNSDQETLLSSTSDNISSNVSEETIPDITDSVSSEELIDVTKRSDALSYPTPFFNEEKKIVEPQVIEENKIIISKEDFSTVIRSFDKLKQDIEDAGMQISMETFNFEEYYQLIIKVFKS